jgi:hypothetical protein
LDDSDNVYVADRYNGRIQKFTSTGAYLAQWATNADEVGIAVDAGGNVYIADDGLHRIEKFTRNGTYLTQWGTPGSGDGQFLYPWGIAVDASGNVYVADNGNNRIQKFTSDGTYLSQWGTYGYESGQFAGPVGVAVDGSGNVYVTDNASDGANNRIQKFTGAGTYITQWGSGQFAGVLCVAVDASGYVYAADNGHCTVQKFVRGSGLNVPGEAQIAFALDPVRPNPARGSALMVQFTLPSAAAASLELLDVAGRIVSASEVGQLGAGRHLLDFGAGRHLAPGIYLVRLQQGANVKVVRAAVLE